MTSAEIRQAFLEFFRDRGHTVVTSSSLIPASDPTLLFTNAGMVQFKDVFLGLEKRHYRRAATAQKCMRVSGKHNDLENVGPSPRHHTFFEMLGNFSFGDYFKREAIVYAWEFMTEVLGLPQERFSFTVYKEDDEAFALWQEIAGASLDRIMRMGKKTNFWMMADTGPCGPNSELMYDRGPEHCTCGEPNCSPALDNDCDRWWELWNLVFMQYDLKADGTMAPLRQTGVDTGLGFERVVAVMAGVDTNYDTDLFQPIMRRTQELVGHDDRARAENLVAYRVIADHSRAMAFLIAEGVLPGNEGQNYVLRMIMRRAMRFGKLLGLSEPFLREVAPVVITVMGDHYRELKERRDFILEVIAQEEERFQQTLSLGLTRLDKVIAGLEAQGRRVIPGREVFRLYDTYGFPPDLTKDVAEERGLEIDRAGFEVAMAEQRERARAAQDRLPYGQLPAVVRGTDVKATRFVGYETLESPAIVVNLAKVSKDTAPVGEWTESVDEGDEVQVLLDITPFYAEAGGQVGDTGELMAKGLKVAIENTLMPVPELIVHYGRVLKGTLRLGERVKARVDADRRLDIARNHTATHLLHRALREVLGEHAQQSGSLVAPDRLRFDFTHLAPLSPEELREIEKRVNDCIRENLSVTAVTLSYDEAIASGAVALFGEKYGDKVRMVSIEGYSRELCGGTHLRSTGEIGFMHIVSEGSIGAGLRRIEAVTGRGAEEYVWERLTLLEEVARDLQVTPEAVATRLKELLAESESRQKELSRLQRQLAREKVTSLVARVEEVEGIKVLASRVEAASQETLREMTDWLRDDLGSAVIVLGAAINGRPALVAAVTPDLVAQGLHAGRLIKEVARMVGGGGGGRATLAQAGGRDVSKMDEALAAVSGLVKKLYSP
ncbi:MAG: alanine--tRNA ligase [Anaerolineae bacterium]